MPDTYLANARAKAGTGENHSIKSIDPPAAGCKSCMPTLRKETEKTGCALRRQFNEKPSIILGCPGKLKARAHLEAGVGVIEVGVIAGQVQLNIKVITVYRLVRLTCCAHVHLQQGMTLSISLQHEASHTLGCLVVVESLNG